MSDEKSISTELFKNHLSMAEMDLIMRAFMSERPIQLNVIGRVKGDAIASASIVGVNNQANGEEVALNTIQLLENNDDFPGLLEN